MAPRGAADQLVVAGWGLRRLLRPARDVRCPHGPPRIRRTTSGLSAATPTRPTILRILPELFENNRAWAARLSERDPDFFPRLARQQHPRHLWIGCSDSRVPANEIVGLMPGELFVHRNVANVVVQTDLNFLSVLQFAVEVLQVEHVMVVGHYGCGGVKAAMQEEPHGLIDNWLRPVQDVARRHRAVLDALPDEAGRVHRLCELNVVEQAVQVCRTTVVHGAWRRGQPLTVHGWIYSLEDGLLRDLGLAVRSMDELPAAYDRAVAATPESAVSAAAAV